jgi:hypothetical protein
MKIINKIYKNRFLEKNIKERYKINNSRLSMKKLNEYFSNLFYYNLDNIYFSNYKLCLTIKETGHYCYTINPINNPDFFYMSYDLFIYNENGIKLLYIKNQNNILLKLKLLCERLIRFIKKG